MVPEKLKIILYGMRANIRNRRAIVFPARRTMKIFREKLPTKIDFERHERSFEPSRSTRGKTRILGRPRLRKIRVARFRLLYVVRRASWEARSFDRGSRREEEEERGGNSDRERRELGGQIGRKKKEEEDDGEEEETLKVRETWRGQPWLVHAVGSAAGSSGHNPNTVCEGAC